MWFSGNNDWKGNPDKKGYYATHPGSEACEFGFGALQRTYAVLAPAHLAIIERAAKMKRHPSTLKDHSSAFVDALATAVGRPVAQPAYLTSAPISHATSFARDWRDHVRAWVRAAHVLGPREPETIVTLFERTMEAVRNPDDAWFGVHKGAVSAVVGGIFLVAVYSRPKDRGVWLLLDPDTDLPKLDNVTYQPVKSAKGAKSDLQWAHITSLGSVSAIVASKDIWRAVSRASETISAFPIGRSRDAVQLRRGKVRISSILSDLPLDSDNVEDRTSRPLFVSPEELGSLEDSVEGAALQIMVNRYERDPVARERCIACHGATCAVCGFDFGDVYGPVAQGFIHVHHLQPISTQGGPHRVNPVADLRPVCANCHAVIHLRKGTPYTIEEMRAILCERGIVAIAGASSNARQAKNSHKFIASGKEASPRGGLGDGPQGRQSRS